MPSQPVSRNIRKASSAEKMSPLPTTGISTASLTARMMLQSALPEYICSFVRPCTQIIEAPASARRLASSTALMLSLSQPARILTVTGILTALTVSRTTSAAKVGFFISAEPSPLPTIFAMGQPMLMSMTEGETSLMVPRYSLLSRSAAARATNSGSAPNNCTAMGSSSARTAARGAVLVRSTVTGRLHNCS